MSQYVHGYDIRESQRLEEQAETLVELLHSDVRYVAGEKVLEAGCGVGAQTITLAQNSPEALFTSVDISADSVLETEKKIAALKLENVRAMQGDIYNLPFAKKSFDHIFVCFVLEHLADPVSALTILKSYLKDGGTLTVIEGDHGSAYFYPESIEAQQVIDCQMKLQKAAGGNANIGRELYPVLSKSGFSQVMVSPRVVYVDSSRPVLVEGFIKKTFTAMIEGIRNSALESNIITQDVFDKGIAALYRTAEKDGVFCYTFFKGVARNV